jgi:hypothetical protein
VAVREEHASFYLSMFGFEKIAEERIYHGTKLKMVLLGVERKNFKWRQIHKIKSKVFYNGKNIREKINKYVEMES